MGLKELRMKRGMTQQQLADKVGMSRPRIAAYESGTNDVSNMTLGNALKFCSALHIANPRKLLDSDSETSADSK